MKEVRRKDPEKVLSQILDRTAEWLDDDTCKKTIKMRDAITAAELGLRLDGRLRDPSAGVSSIVCLISALPEATRVLLLAGDMRLTLDGQIIDNRKQLAEPVEVEQVVGE